MATAKKSKAKTKEKAKKVESVPAPSVRKKGKAKDKKAVAKAKDAPATKKSTQQLLAATYRNQLLTVDKEAGITPGTGTQLDPIHTGSLVQDYVCGGGARPGLFVSQGLDASGKSTSCVHMADQTHAGQVPLRNYYDPEGAVGPDFVQHVLRHADTESLFGEDVGYYQDTIMEDVLGHIAGVVDMFPEKDYNDDLKSWVYKVPKDKKDVSAVGMLTRLRNAGLKPDDAYGKGLDFHIIPTDYAGPEAFLALDSWASLVPRILKENAKKKDLAGNDAMMARVMGQYIPLFGGDLKKRGIILWSVNQLRTNPRQMFGDPLYMKAAGTLRYYITCTNRMSARAVPQGLDRDKESGALGIEPSVTGEGVDRYAYKGVNNLKNKWGRPFIKGMVRIWTSDSQGNFRGIDPVYDVMEYLRMTGQQDGGNKVLKFTPRASAPWLKELTGKKIPYLSFKRLILAEHVGDKDLLSQALKELKLSKPLKVRENCIQQMRKDPTLWAGAVKSKPDDEQDESDDE